MRERIKEIGYRLEDKLKSLCGEITPDKRITVILVMLLLLATGNLYFTFSTIYNWGKESEGKRQLEIEHIGQPESGLRKDKNYDLMDSPVDREFFDLHRQEAPSDSMDKVKSNNEKFKTYERTIKNKYPRKAKA